MTAELHEGRVLQSRFALERALVADVSSHLWLAHDRRLDAAMLLRIHVGPEADVRAAVARDAKRHRRLHHPHVARICDVHTDDALLLVSIVPGEGELMSALLARTGPVPYRRVIETVRPLVDAIAYLHENGAEHGRIDPRHVLVTDDSRWILLPADATQPAGSDMQRLGRLIASLLTGAETPGDGRGLNELPDQLHGGRTVPALLAQLVTDLCAEDANARPIGMRDVLGRLDQLDEMLAPPTPPVVTAEPSPPVVPPAPTDPMPAALDAGTIVTAGAVDSSATPSAASSATSTAAASARAVVTWPRLAGLVAVALILGAAIMLVPRMLAGDEAGTETTPDDGSVVESPPSESPLENEDADGAPTPEELAALAAARADADQALDALLVARRGADEIGAADWAGPAYGAAAARAADADAARLDERFAEAAAGYRSAAASFEQVVASADATRERLMAEGDDALAAADARRATDAFRRVLMIEPGNDAAEIGLQRASTVEALVGMLATGRDHEDNGRLALALIEYATAAELDPRSTEAAADLERIRTAIADAEFRAVMARGLEAYHRGAYDDAREHFLEAQTMRPDADEAADALAMIDEARLRARVSDLRAQAEGDERDERWQRAWNAYRQVLAIDPAIQFAQEGKARCEQVMRLEQHAQRYLDDPSLLVKDGSRADAKRLVEEIARFGGRGPTLQSMYDRLATKVRLANTPIRVTLRSDGKTEVDVYRVGRYGSFEAHELTLLPGEYTVVGHRRGYKDVRVTLVVEPGAEGTSVTVICTEAI